MPWRNLKFPHPRPMQPPATPLHLRNLDLTNKIVIPPVPASRGTGAKRSGGICSSLYPPSHMANNEAANPLGNPPPRWPLQVRPPIKESLVIPSGLATENPHQGKPDNQEKNHSLLFLR